MNIVFLAFLLVSLAGVATMIGVVPIFIHFNNKRIVISACLAFAAGVMVCVSIIDLIPEGMKMIRGYFSEIFVLIISFLVVFLGIIFSYLIDRVVLNHDGDSLYRAGILSMIGIIMHNIPEGIVTFISTNQNTMLGISLVIAIGIHNIPEGISISVPIYYSTGSRIKALFYTFLSGLSELLGAFIAYLFLMPIINDLILGLLFLFTAGVMLQISLITLFPTSYKYNYYKLSWGAFLFGIIFMLCYFYIIFLC